MEEGWWAGRGGKAGGWKVEGGGGSGNAQEGSPEPSCKGVVVRGGGEGGRRQPTHARLFVTFPPQTTYFQGYFHLFFPFFF